MVRRSARRPAHRLDRPLLIYLGPIATMRKSWPFAGHLRAAEEAARELGRLSLIDALAFTLLLAQRDPRRYEAAAVRWHDRFELEAKGVTLREAQLAPASLASYPDPASSSAAGSALSELAVARLDPSKARCDIGFLVIYYYRYFIYGVAIGWGLGFAYGFVAPPPPPGRGGTGTD